MRPWNVWGLERSFLGATARVVGVWPWKPVLRPLGVEFSPGPTYRRQSSCWASCRLRASQSSQLAVACPQLARSRLQIGIPVWDVGGPFGELRASGFYFVRCAAGLVSAGVPASRYRRQPAGPAIAVHMIGAAASWTTVAIRGGPTELPSFSIGSKTSS